MGEVIIEKIKEVKLLPGYLRALLYLYLKYKETGNPRIELPKRFKRKQYPFNWNDFYRLEAEGLVVIVRGIRTQWVELLEEGIKEVEKLRRLIA